MPSGRAAQAKKWEKTGIDCLFPFFMEPFGKILSYFPYQTIGGAENCSM